MPPASSAPLPAWNPRMALGIPIVDHDHGHAIEVMAEMLSAAQAPAGPDPVRLSAALAAFDTHCHEHFAREEALMRRFGFPPYPVHRQAHEDFLAETARIRERLAAGETEAAIAFAGYAWSWFQNHLASMDMITCGFLGQFPEACTLEEI